MSSFQKSYNDIHYTHVPSQTIRVEMCMHIYKRKTVFRDRDALAVLRLGSPTGAPVSSDDGTP